MLRVKRIVAITMAMLICASFCLSAHAEEWGDYINPGVTSAVAHLEINEWPQDTGDTDLEATTSAWWHDYYYNLYERFDSYSVYVHLSLTLEDFSSYSDDLELNSEDENPLTANISGKPLLCGEPYYAIITYGSSHYVKVYEYTEVNAQSGIWYNAQPWQDGRTVHLGPSY